MNQEVNSRVVTALVDALQTFNSPQTLTDTSVVTAFNERNDPIRFINRGGQSIVLARNNNYLITICREPITPEEINQYQQTECVMDIVHVLFPEHFPKQRIFFREVEIDRQKETIAGTVRRYIHGEEVETDSARNNFYGLLENLKQLGLHFIPDTQGNFIIDESGNYKYVDLLESLDPALPLIVDSHVENYMQETKKYTKRQIEHVLRLVNKLRELKFLANI